MNKCLILEWWCRILSADPKELWLCILKAIYFPSSSPLMVSGSGGSQFWRQLLKVQDEFRALVKFYVGGGSFVRFWLDWWTGDGPLAASFLFIFYFVAFPSISIAELTAGQWDLGWRSLSPEELDD